MNMKFKRKLPIPQDIKAMYPVSNEGKEVRDTTTSCLISWLLIIGFDRYWGNTLLATFLTIHLNGEKRIEGIPLRLYNKP